MKIEDEEEKKQDKYKEENKESKVSLEEIQDWVFIFRGKDSYACNLVLSLYVSSKGSNFQPPVYNPSSTLCLQP